MEITIMRITYIALGFPATRRSTRNHVLYNANTIIISYRRILSSEF